MNKLEIQRGTTHTQKKMSQSGIAKVPIMGTSDAYQVEIARVEAVAANPLVTAVAVASDQTTPIRNKQMATVSHLEIIRINEHQNAVTSKAMRQENNDPTTTPAKRVVVGMMATLEMTGAGPINVQILPSAMKDRVQTVSEMTNNDPTTDLVATTIVKHVMVANATTIAASLRADVTTIRSAISTNQRVGTTTDKKGHRVTLKDVSHRSITAPYPRRRLRHARPRCVAVQVHI